MKIVSVAQMRQLETAAFAAGISEDDLQARAATVIADEVGRLAGVGDRVVVFVGHGNNGRDGGLAALRLARLQRAVEVVLAPRHALSAEELGSLRSLGVDVVHSEQQEAVGPRLQTAVVAVDALAGIGTHGALREPLAGLTRVLNEFRAHTVLALDIPSGIDADLGAVPGEAIKADVTVTLGAVKQGLLRFPAAERVGRLIARDIGIPPEAERNLPYSVLEPHGLPERPLGAHKYGFGRVLIVAGSDHFLGAPVLCAGGALRVGAGLVTVGSTSDVRRTVAAQLPEATYTVEDVELHADKLKPYLDSHQAVVIGPGLGRGPEVTQFVLDVVRNRANGKLVIDADALVALGETPDWWTLLPPETVLTPHAGELARLVGGELSKDEAPWETAGRRARQWQCVLVYKGPFTSVAEASGSVHVWPHANPALASGGTGDVLAGVCGGLLAQGCSAADAARLAVAVHGLAAERVTRQRAWRTLLASDLFAEIPAVLAELTQPR
jgi:ADP-dependent NAD(P)H-hydrate dehydratase / NAD(P)H-hydrate epimerase